MRTTLLITKNQNHSFVMQKRKYQIPLWEEIPLAGLLEEPFCGMSGGEYDPTPGHFDDDSD